MKNVQKHFQDFFTHSNLKDASTSSPFNSFPRFRKMQKCFEGIVTHDIPDCLVIINANKNSMAILEADLDGLDGNRVFELVECICKGQIFILPTLKVLISKPNKKKQRLLGLASPREKIMQHFK